MAVSLLDAWVLTSTGGGSLGSRTASAGTDRLLVYVAAEESGSREPTAVTYGGQSMTQAVIQQTGGGFPVSGSIWYLNDAGIQAASGTSFGVTFDQVTHNGQFRAGTAVFEGVDQTSPIVDFDSSLDDTTGNTTTAADLTLTTDDDGYAVWLFAESTSGASVDATWTGITEQLEIDASSMYASIADSTTDGTNLTAELDGGSGIGRNVQVAVTLAPAIQTVELDQPQEADSAFAIAAVGTSTVTLDVADETNSAFVISAVPSGNIGVGQAEETDSAQTLGVVKSVPVGLAEESCLAQIVTEGSSGVTFLLDNWTLVSSSATEAEAGVTFGISAGTNRMLVAAIAEDSSVGKPTGMTYGGQPMVAGPRAARGATFIVTSQFFILNEAGIQAATSSQFEVQGVEVHNGDFRLLASSYENVGQTGFRDTDTADDTGDVAGPVTIESSGRATSFSLITNSAAGVNFQHTNATEIIENDVSGIALSLAEQTTDGSDVTFEPFSLDPVNNNALAVISMKGLTLSATLDQPSETDTAQALVLQTSVQIGAGSEVDSAFSITASTSQFVALGIASETDSAQDITIVLPGQVAVGQASETDTAQSVESARALAVGLASETDSAFATTFRREVFVSLAVELDTAFSVRFVGQEGVEALARRNTAGTTQAEFVAEAELEAKRLGQMRRAIEREDEELMAMLPAIAKSLLNLRG